MLLDEIFEIDQEELKFCDDLEKKLTSLQLVHGEFFIFGTLPLSHTPYQKNMLIENEDVGSLTCICFLLYILTFYSTL